MTSAEAGRGVDQAKLNGSVPAPAIGVVDGDSFAELVSEAVGPVVVEFMSYGCGHCRVMEPLFEQVAGILRAQARCFRVNVALDPALASLYRITGTPTIVMFSAGKEVGRLRGPHPILGSLLASIRMPFEL